MIFEQTNKATMVAPPNADVNLKLTALARPSSYASMPKVSPVKQSARKAIKKGATKAKAVRFSKATPKIIATDIVNDGEYACWYLPQDYARVKLGILTSIQAITSVFKQSTPSYLDLSEHCLRGIETGISNELYRTRKHRIYTTKHSVLEQQRLQRILGVSDPLAIRSVSLQCSHAAQESAEAAAKLDSQL